MRVFFDTNIWIELLAIKSPEKEYERKQAIHASSTLKQVKKNNDSIVTCKEQLCEIIQAVLKIQMRAYNRVQKANHTHAGVGSVKEFRKSREFKTANRICRQVIDDINKLAIIDSEFDYDIERIINDLSIADINDSMYYHYCNQNGIVIFTFDQDIVNLDYDNKIVKILV